MSVLNNIVKRYYWVSGIVALGISVNFLAEVYFSKLLNEFIIVEERLQHHVKLLNNVGNLRTHVTLAQSKVHGLIITGSGEFTENVSKIIDDDLMSDLQEIKTALETDRTLKPKMDSLSVIIARMIRFMHYTIETNNRQGKSAAEKLVETGEGKKLREKIFALIEDMDNSIEASIKKDTSDSEKRAKHLQRLDTWMHWGVTVFVILLFSIIVKTLLSSKKLVIELANAQAREEVASLAKDHFMANINHELRTPLNSVVGYADLLQKTPLGAAQSQFVNAIQFSSENLLQIVNQLLDFSKFQSGVLVVEKVTFNPRDLLDQVENTFIERFRKKGILLSLTIADDVPYLVSGDVLKLSQVLTNVIGNAYKFTEKGSVQIAVQAIHDSVGKVWMKFTVSDTGIGIEQSSLAHIFDRFYQANLHYNRKYEGTGLGLAISKHLVEIMGGEISVSSELNKGSTFQISLPLTIPPANDEIPPPPVKIPVSRVLKVLVIDDNELNLNLVSHVLASWKYEVVPLKDGQSAITRLTQEKFDLVLMDIQMPEMDGYTLARKIRNELRLTVPIIALTAHSGKSESERCINAGMNDYISKPFKEIELYEIISKTVDGVVTTIVDLGYLKNISKGNVQFEEGIIRQFLENVPQELIMLEQCLANLDSGGIHKVLHDLKANISILGLEKILNDPIESILKLNNETSASDALKFYNIIKETCFKAIEEIKGMKL